MTAVVPKNLLQVLADYTSQFLEAVQHISDEFEDDILELHHQAKRICTVLHVIRECTAPPSSAPHGTAELTAGASVKPIEIALRGIGRLVAELSGLPDIGAAPTEVRGARMLRAVGRPASLAEAALELFGHNTKIIYRRKDKRPREAGANSGEESQQCGTVYSRVSVSQRKSRFAIYTARVALFPNTFYTPVSVSEGPEGAMQPFVSPAVRDFATLNVEAECEMLEAFYKLDTKTQLLREWPSLRSTVERLQDSLRSEGVQFTRAGSVGTEQSQQPLTWFEFPFTESGVVRMIVRHALAVDFTWEILRGGQWRVLGLHWLLRARPTPPYLDTVDSAGSGRAEERGNGSPSFGTASTLRVEPAYNEATLRFLSKCFESGLECGAVGALRIADAVLMEVIETQCRDLKDNFFMGPLGSCLVLDVRPGTHVSLTFTWSFASPAHVAGSPARGESNSPLYLKYKLSKGTVVLERRRGTDTRTAVQSDMYAECCVATDEGQQVVVVDVERQLWQFVCA